MPSRKDSDEFRDGTSCVRFPTNNIISQVTVNSIVTNDNNNNNNTNNHNLNHNHNNNNINSNNDNNNNNNCKFFKSAVKFCYKCNVRKYD